MSSLSSQLNYLDCLKYVEDRNLNPNKKEDLFNKIHHDRNSKHFQPKDFDEIGFNELHWSVICGLEKRIEVLIKEKFVDINEGTKEISLIDSWNITPLHLAVMHSHYSICHFLVSQGSDSTIRSKTRITPLTLKDDESALDLALRKNDAPFIHLMRKEAPNSSDFRSQEIVLDQEEESCILF